jgi:GT2 family glycosyltransferase
VEEPENKSAVAWRNPMQIDISIIVLNYCSLNETQNLVSQLVDMDDTSRVIIVDNNSPDNSYNLLIDRFGDYSNINILQNQHNTGYAAGNNVGIRYALEKLNSPYIAIMNPDVEITEGFLRNMVEYLEADHNIAAITGVMLYPPRSLNIASIAWKIPSTFDYVFLCSGLLKHIYNPIIYEKFSNSNPMNPGVYYVDTLPGSCFVVRAAVLKKIGFLAEGTFLYCEEQILAKKIRDLGLTSAISLKDSYIHNHTLEQDLTKRNLKQVLQHYYWLSVSRLYYIMNYSNHNKISFIFLPLVMLSMLLGFAEVVFMHLLHKVRLLSKS